MNYKLNTEESNGKVGTFGAVKKLWPLFEGEKRNLLFAFVAIIINSTVNLLGPFIIGRTVDLYILTKQYSGVITAVVFLLVLFSIGLVASYLQTKWMGGVSQRILFKLRSAVFTKLQELPVEFFNQNKAGDLISRINNDTDKLNQFFSQSLMQFIGSVFIMLGAGVFLLSINPKIGALTLAPAILLLILTQALSPWVKRMNAVSLKSTGDISAEIQESLTNFKVIVAFNRRDYFRKRFEESNEDNYRSATKAGIANNFFTPIYSLASTVAQLIVIVFGIYLILHGQFTLGLLISFISYSNNFYNPLRQLASLWSNLQIALAGWDRISAILAMETNLPVLPSLGKKDIMGEELLEFKNVSFGYKEGDYVLRDVNFTLERGKTYALVGPTGGGKTTTALLMARIFDPTKGTVFLEGLDLRSYDVRERVKKIGFILQEPFLFTGTVKDNIIYGNDEYQNFTDKELTEVIKEQGLEDLLTWFDQGLQTTVETGGETISLGQRQLIAFVRAILRKPKVLILDEATANIDTVTEQLLEGILSKLPKETTRVVIAHRLNTIENADEIFFVNAGEITRAGSMEDAMGMLLHGKRES